MIKVPPHAATLENEDLDVAIQAAFEGGKLLRNYWEVPPRNFQAKAGTTFDLVSEADGNADSAVQKVIRSAFPSDKIISEELNPELNDVNHKRVWIIDPLDGTSAFLFKTDPTAPSVMIALLIDGIPTVSVILQPIIARWTYSVAGKGVFQDGMRMKFPDHNNMPPFSQAWVDLNQYGDSQYESPIFKKIDSVVRANGGARLVSRMSPYSAIALRLLVPAEDTENASRQLCAAVHDHNREMPKQLPWDIIPIKLIVEEAGGFYVDTKTGKSADPFDLKGPILIGSRAICDEILKRIIV